MLLPQLPSLANFDIRILTVIWDYKDSVQDWKKELVEQEWKSIHALERLRVVEAHQRDYFDVEDGEVKDKLVLEWLKDIDDFEKVADGEEVHDEPEDKHVFFDAEEARWIVSDIRAPGRASI